MKLDQPPTQGSCTNRHPRCPSVQGRCPLTKYPNLSAVRICEEIARGPGGYTGGVHPASLSPNSPSHARARLPRSSTHSQAQAMQVDWGTCGCVQVGDTIRKVSVFVAVLCYSRLMFIEFTLSQRKAEFYRGIVNASPFLWRSPRAISSTT